MQPPVVDAGCADGGAGRHLRAVGEVPDALARRELATHAFSSEQDLRAEPAGLVAGAFGQLRAGDPVRKAKVILDVRTAPGLAAHRPALDDDRPQPLGGRVDGGAQTGRPGAIDCQVVLDMRRVAEQPELLGQAADRRPFKPRAVGKFAHRQPLVADAVESQLARVRVVAQLDPLERHVVAVKEVTSGVTGWRSRAADDRDHGLLRRVVLDHA